MHDAHQLRNVLSGRFARNICLLACAGALFAPLAGCGHQREIEAKVRSTLKISDDAKFSQVQVSKDGWAACGMVNAKNSIGGYIGDNFFMVIAGEVRFAGNEDATDMKNCCIAAIQHADGKATGNDISCQRLSPPLNFEGPK